jgi:hypothetical protein
LGEGTITLISLLTYNDDKWHTIEAAREGKQSILKVDEEFINTGESIGSSTELQVRIITVKLYLFCTIITLKCLIYYYPKI